MTIRSSVRSSIRSSVRSALGTGGGAVVWEPSVLFGGADIGFAVDLTDGDLLFQDAARTTPAGALDPIGGVTDISGKGNHLSQTSTSRPLFDGGAKFDGINDSLASPSLALSGGNKATIIVSVRKLSDAAQGSVVGIPSAANADLVYPRSASITGQALVFGAVELRSANVAAPVASVLTAQVNGDGATDADKLKCWRDGVAAATFAGAGVTISFIDGAVHIGRRGGSTLPLNAIVYRCIFINRLLPEAERAEADTWCGVPLA